MSGVTLRQMEQYLTGPQSTWVALWAGLAVLTLALLVLARTRWGRSRALGKCVILSLLAHVLLAGFATTVRLVTSAELRERGEEKIVRVTVVQPLDDAPSHEAGQPAMPWDALDADATRVPPPDAPERLPVDTKTPVRTASAHMEIPPKSPPALPAEAPRRAESPEPGDEDEPARDESIVARATPVEAGEKKSSDAPPIAAPPDATAAARRPPSTGDDVRRDAPLPHAPGQPIAGLPDAAPRRGTVSDVGDAEDPLGVRSAAPHVLLARRQDSASSTDAGDASDISPRLHALVRPAAEVPKVYKERFAPDRNVAARRRGATKESEEAVGAALRWLARGQSADGRWDADRFGAGRESRVAGADRDRAGAQADTGISGLALLAMLGRGHTHHSGKFRDNVTRGLNFLIRSQKADGSLDGDARTFARTYCHGMATLALSEAYAMTGDERLREPVQRAIDWTVASQHRESGSWRYWAGDPGDTSQLGWQVMAIKSAQLGGTKVPEQTHSGIRRFLRSVASGSHGGYASYRPGEAASRAMTAEALVCRQFLGIAGDDDSREALQYVTGQLPGDGTPNFYYWYYATLAMYPSQDESWRRWNDALTRTLIESQETRGESAGSWNADSVWGSYGGRIYTTAMATLCLEVPYRYLPIYQQQ